MSDESLLGDIQFRIRHTMLPVSNIRRTVDFYTRLLGMDVMRVRQSPEQNQTTVYLGYGCEDEEPALEVVQTGNPGDVESVPRWAGHTALYVSNVRSLCEIFRSQGIRVVSEPKPVRPGSPDLVAWIQDPDGYSIELTERHSVTGPPLTPEAVKL
jgi:lactoylglutathione lyase